MSFKIKSLKGIKNFFADIRNLDRDQEVIIDYYYFKVSVKEIRLFCEEVEKISKKICSKQTAFKVLEGVLQYKHYQIKKTKKQWEKYKKPKWAKKPIPSPKKWEILLKNYKRHCETDYDDKVIATYFLKNNGLLKKEEAEDIIMKLKN